jgi:hypothetical protein
MKHFNFVGAFLATMLGSLGKSVESALANRRAPDGTP